MTIHNDRIIKYRKISFSLVYIMLAAFIMMISVPGEAKGVSKSNYNINASAAPINNKFTKLSTYNNKTKQYYLLRSYLEQLEKDGGGKLILKKGKYVITNTLYVPSNVTIVLQDGVQLIKGKDTGSKKLTPSSSIFQLVAPSKATKEAAASKYKGASNIKIIGEGTAIIDLNYIKNATGVVLGHNSQITIEGITFQNLYDGHMIKIAASEEVIIKENLFQNHKASASLDRAAIAIEVPDAVTKAFSYPWSKNDKTVNRDIIIENNVFSGLERAIGTAKYSEDRYHQDIRIIGNDINSMKSHGIRGLNWENAIILNNKFSNITNEEKNARAILLSGAKNPTIKENSFEQSNRAIQIMPWKNNGNGSQYKITYNTISNQNKGDMLKNYLKDMGEYVIRYNKAYNEFDKETEKWVIYDALVKDFIIHPDSETFQKLFLNFSTYNDKSRQYYVIRSYLEQLEKIGGGTLTLEAGSYDISNTLYVPSNVTIYLKDGVVINKTEDTGTKNMESAKSLFVLVAPSKSTVEGAYGGYDGEGNIKILGEGKATIDLRFTEDALGIVLGHNIDVTISGITFQNMYSGHFIELDASKNVFIDNNIFKNHKASRSGIKEGINIDTPDKTTGGFNHIWTKHDATPNKDIFIRKNTFDHLERAIGTHKYSGGRYHENVQITDNNITNTASDAIRIINWSRPIIKDNEIRMVAGGSNGDRAILASGIIHPVITKNIFADVAKPIQIMPWKNNGLGSQYEITYNELSPEDITLMRDNSLIRVGENFIRYNKTYNDFERDTEKFYINK